MRAKRASNDVWAKLRVEARAMRASPTPAEDVLWQHLKGKRLDDLKFRRQHTIDRFIVDFYCAEASLVIELDGPIHDQPTAQDDARAEHLEQLGLRLLRFKNEDVEQGLRAVLDEIRAAIRDGCHNPGRPSNSSSPLHNVERGRGRGNP